MSEKHPSPRTSRSQGRSSKPAATLPQRIRPFDRFRKDLPALLKTHRGQWTAYTATEQIALDADPRAVQRAIQKRRLKAHEFIMMCIEPLEPNVVER